MASSLSFSVSILANSSLLKKLLLFLLLIFFYKFEEGLKGVTTDLARTFEFDIESSVGELLVVAALVIIVLFCVIRVNRFEGVLFLKVDPSFAFL